MSILTNPDLWADDDDTTPPVQWQPDTSEYLFNTENAAAAPITYIGLDDLPETLAFSWEITTPPDEGEILYFAYRFGGAGSWSTIALGSTEGLGEFEITIADVTDGLEFGITSELEPETFTPLTSGVVSLGAAPDPTDINCDCNDTNDNETLAQLRVRLLRRLGYSAQAANPPPGMAELLNDFLFSAHRFMYQKYPNLRTKRFFTWNMQPGQRFYGLRANEQDGDCTLYLDPKKLEWVGIIDLNDAWLEMASPIPPAFYTVVTEYGIPSRYEIRQCIEVFPPPDAEYRLVVKGEFLPLGTAAFAVDADKTQIDSELVFLWALANAKAHYRQPDAADVAGMAREYLGDLIAGKHLTNRYVPNSGPEDPLPKPVFLPLGGAPP